MQKFITDEKVIEVKITDKEQLFSDYSYTDDNLNPELSNFIVERANQTFPLSVKENFIINIHTDDASIHTAEVARCIHRHFHGAYDTAKRELHHLWRFASLMIVSGLVALVLRFFAMQYINNFFITEILNIASWVFIWEAVNTIFLERREVRRECIIMRRLAYADIRISGFNKRFTPPQYIK